MRVQARLSSSWPLMWIKSCFGPVVSQTGPGVLAVGSGVTAEEFIKIHRQVDRFTRPGRWRGQVEIQAEFGEQRQELAEFGV